MSLFCQYWSLFGHCLVIISSLFGHYLVINLSLLVANGYDSVGSGNIATKLEILLSRIILFLHKRTSGERSRRHPVCILIAMALRIFLYLAFSLILIDFYCFSLIFH